MVSKTKAEALALLEPGTESEGFRQVSQSLGAGAFHSARSDGKVVLVGKSSCTFCARAQKVLDTMVDNDRLVILDVDSLEDGAAVRELAKDASNGCKTVPMVFHGSKFIGGCDNVVAMEGNGELTAELSPNLKVVHPYDTEGEEDREVRGSPPTAWPLFYFPAVLNGVALRFIGFQATCFCAVAIIWRNEAWAGWMMLLLGIDSLIRLVAGGTASPVGALAAICALPFKERLVTGPQKQFATFIGACFAGSVGVLLLMGHSIAGAVVAAVLLVATGLAAFFDFCVGCTVFSYLISWGIVSPAVNDLAISQKPLVQAQMDRVDNFEGELCTPTEYVHCQPGQPETPADLRVKAGKTDEHKRRGFDPVKNVMIFDFSMPLGVSALALAWKMGPGAPAFATGHLADGITWQVLTGLSITLFVPLLSLTAAKSLKFPRRLLKEIVHPLQSGGCAYFPMCLEVLALLLWDADANDWIKWVSLSLFWMGAIMLKAHMLYSLAAVVANRSTEEQTQAHMLLPIVGCTLASVVAPLFSGFHDAVDYDELGGLLFGLSAILSVVLMGSTLLEAVSHHWSDERRRPAMGIWAAALQLPFLAHLAQRVGPAALLGEAGAARGDTPAVGFELDTLERALFFAGCSIFLLLFWLAVPLGFLIKVRFDFSLWALAFPLDVLAASCAVYSRAAKGTDAAHHFSSGVALAALAAASYGNATLLLNTVFWLCKRRWLRPEPKWAPLALNTLTHAAFRAAGARLKVQSGALREQLRQGACPLGLARSLAAEWETYALVLEWHSQQEDRIIFRQIDAFNPMATRDGYLQHKELERMEAKINDAAATIAGSASWGHEMQAAAQAMADTLTSFLTFMAKHMTWEDQNLLALNRRTLNLDLQIGIVRKIWEAFEAMSVEEFRSSLAGVEREPSQALKGGKWGASSRREGDLESMLRFPPAVPNGKVPLEKQQVWRVVLPYVIRHLPEPTMRVRFVKCWVWALPERAQLIGEMVYRGLDDASWTAIAKEVPEIVPRGLPGWVRRV